MRDLTLDLDTTDFAALFELGRSLIPTEAPGWTDWNTHDPGIMLIELMAWVADAQIYSLARLRHDERRAYTNLLGVVNQGPRSGQGLVRPASDATPTWRPGSAVDTHTPVYAKASGAPPFFPTHAVVLTRATLVRLATQYANGTVRDWTRANRQMGATFRPFDAVAGAAAQLTLECSGPLIESAPAQSGANAGAGNSGVTISIGFQIYRDPAVAASLDAAQGPVLPASQPQVVLVDSTGSRPLTLIADTTLGMLRSGVTYQIVIGSAGASFLVPPQVEHVALNVIPVQQLQIAIDNPPSFGTGKPDQQYVLQSGSLVTTPTDPPFAVEIADQGPFTPWTVVADLGASGPDDAAFVLDPASGSLFFGNGVNGRIPGAGARLRVTYPVTQGVLGNLNSGLTWLIAGVPGFEGINDEATRGGSAAPTEIQLQAAARRNANDAHTLVTSEDLVSAAEAIPALGVIRAIELSPALNPGPPVAGYRRLIAMSAAQGSTDLADWTPSPDWLETIRRRLAPQLPLGQLLRVEGPRFVTIQVRAILAARSGLDLALVKAHAEARLRAAFQRVQGEFDGKPPWPFGQDVAPLTVKAWLRNVDGVAAVVSVTLLGNGRGSLGKPIAMGPSDLPWLVLGPSDISVQRLAAGVRS